VVYKARDTHLNRPVAKVLPVEAVANSERKRRFVQEAKAASALNHPNIIHVYDIYTLNGVDFIAMEYVPGKTLDKLVGRKGLGLGEALKYAVQIADALAKAHGAGIVHRDLKPANIMVTEEGLVKVPDFGLAKLTEQTEADDATVTLGQAPRTEEGTIVGTVAYMSPEQAQGKKVDARSDIFSLGSVLYEMITGRRAFQRDTKFSTLTTIARDEPKPVSELAPEVPRDLEKIIQRCLRKDPDYRFQHMDDLKVALREMKEESDSGKLRPVPAVGRPTRSRLVLAFAALLIATCAGIWWLTRGRVPAARPSRNVVMTRMTMDSRLTTDPALSPDGKLLAYASDRSGEGNLDIWVQQVSGGEATRLTRDPADDSEPVFSPDGSKIAFRSERDGGGIYIMSALGGEARRIARQGRNARFSPDGSQIAYTVGELQFAAGGKSFVTLSEGGQPRQIQPDFFSVIAPIWSPDGRQLLFAAGSRDAKSETYDWWVAPVDGGAAVRTAALAVFRQQGLPTLLLPSLWRAKGNSVIFSARSGDAVNLWQISISPQTWQANGALRQVTFGTGLEAQPTVAGGRIAFSVLPENTNVWSLPLEANFGKVLGEIQRLTESADRDVAPSVAADGIKLAFFRGTLERGSIWLKDLQKGKERLLATTAASYAQMAPDGSRVVFEKLENQNQALYVTTSSGGEAERICQDCRTPNGWSHDGKKALYEMVAARAIVLLDVASGQKAEILKHPKYGLSRGPLLPG
jgi:serine/threonine protein kinase